MALVEDLRLALQRIKEQNHPPPYYAIVSAAEAEELRKNAEAFILQPADELHVPAVASAKVVGQLFGELYIYEPIADPKRLEAERMLHGLIQEKLEPYRGQALTPLLAKKMLCEIRHLLNDYVQQGVLESIPSIAAVQRNGIIMFVDPGRADAMKEDGWVFLAAV